MEDGRRVLPGRDKETNRSGVICADITKVCEW